MHHTDEGWQPTKVIRIGEAEATSTGVTRVMTDAGLAFCKPIGNRQGEQVLASEWVCLKLAKWLGLPTFRAAIIDLTEDATFDLPEHKGTQFRAKAGPCFLTESTPGRQWSKDPAELETLVNTEDLTKLVAFDTWVLNRDRHYPDYTVRKPNYGNVFLAFVEGKPEHARLVAMDHTHCFDNGQLHAKLSNIDFVKDDRIYGLFPEFVAHMSLITLAGVSAQLRTLASADVKTILDEVPTEWQVDAAARKAWSELILARASFVADELPKKLGAEPTSTPAADETA